MGWGGRWEGGSGWGTHVNPWLIHVNVWQKPLQYCKVISFQLIKINEEKKKENGHPRICLGLAQNLIMSTSPKALQPLLLSSRVKAYLLGALLEGAGSLLGGALHCWDERLFRAFLFLLPQGPVFPRQ